MKKNKQLSKKRISAVMHEIDKLDLKNVSLSEIKKLIKPLFNNYTVCAPVQPAGIYIYRGRICKKPFILSDLSYPPKDVVKEYGRVNNIGQSMFYGTIGRTPPLYELNVQDGDTMVLSTWQTKTKLLLNHVGFSHEAQKRLATDRDFATMYEWAKNTLSVSDTNAYLYNLLANIFVQKIPKNKNYLYKLSIAIADELISDPMFQGIVYPSIAYSGDADNIVLKPSFVDDNMQFLTAEFLEISINASGESSYKILDSASEIDTSGKILWAGKHLGYTMESDALSIQKVGDDWTVKNKKGDRQAPKAISEIVIPRSAAHYKYLNDFKHTYKITKEYSASYLSETVVVKGSLILDFKNGTKYLSYYIPECSFSADIALNLLRLHSEVLNLENQLKIEQTESGEMSGIKPNDLLFEGLIYMYIDNRFNVQYLKDHFTKLKVEFIFN